MRGAFGIGVTLALGALTSQNVKAQVPPSPSLWAAWEAPAECPQEGAFVAQIEGFLGTALNARADRQLEIVGRARTEEARGYVVKLRVRTSRRTQERELAHHDCGELTEAAALIVAFAWRRAAKTACKKRRKQTLIAAAATATPAQIINAATKMPIAALVFAPAHLIGTRSINIAFPRTATTASRTTTKPIATAEARRATLANRATIANPTTTATTVCRAKVRFASSTAPSRRPSSVEPTPAAMGAACNARPPRTA